MEDLLEKDEEMGLLMKKMSTKMKSEEEIPCSKTINLFITDNEKKEFALLELSKLLLVYNKTLRDFPNMLVMNERSNVTFENSLLWKELAYDRAALSEERKTFLWRALSASIRAKGHIVINVSSSGSQLAELIVQAKLIIWDEAPMIHKHCFEALDKTMRDLLRFVNEDSDSDGTIGVDNDGYAEFDIPSKLLLKSTGDPISTIVRSTFPNFTGVNIDGSCFKSSAILVPTLEVANEVNQYMSHLT
ncbi:uncharacterized protein LOC116029569 [Ipomoea triloba]|uniref:uncharacterized protein LOC116029569 n=1 Tax=Ipomoea triloba TaxID=35885 RepID=UPI00125DC832|nr:uncharacterized protein LOC116029569 [Ipomoea triloba]